MVGWPSSPSVNCLPWELGEPPEAVTNVVVLGEPSATAVVTNEVAPRSAASCPGLPTFRVVGACRERQGSPKPLGTGGSRMWKAVKEAIQTTGQTLRFIAIIAMLALVAWIMSPH